MKTFKLPPVYPITDKQLARMPTHLSILKELVRGGARWVQVRDKSTPTREFLTDLRECVEFATENGVVLLVNDRCDLALCSGARGVHLGQDDLPPSAAQAILGKYRILGLSTHSLQQIREASSQPVQYLGFGPVFETSTKQNASAVVGLRRLSLACKASRLPVVAIGGIGLDQIRPVLDAGAASAAVISSLMLAKDIARQMERFFLKAREK